MGVPGHTQLLILVGLVLLLFGPVLLRLLRRLLPGGSRGAGRRPAPGGGRASDGGHAHCPHCGAANPRRARFCCECGKPMDFVDV